MKHQAWKLEEGHWLKVGIPCDTEAEAIRNAIPIAGEYQMIVAEPVGVDKAHDKGYQDNGAKN